MAMQYRRNLEEESSDESDEDYVPPEQVEVEDDGSQSGEADLEPSSGGDTDLDIGKRKRKRKTRCRATQRSKKKVKTDDFSDNNDETTSNETLLSLPLKNATASSATANSHPEHNHSHKGALPRTWTSSGTSSGTGYSSSTPSPTERPLITPAPISDSIRDESKDHVHNVPSSLFPGNGPSGSGAGSDTTAARDHSDSLSSSVKRTTEVCGPTNSASPSSSGLSSVLAKLSGKKKLSTLEKSQMEWKKFKTDEGIEDDLTKYNKGKGGYLDRKEFLERSNVREYEFGQNLRSTANSKR